MHDCYCKPNSVCVMMQTGLVTAVTAFALRLTWNVQSGRQISNSDMRNEAPKLSDYSRGVE